MLEAKFSEDLDKIAVGLVGEGSDCFGFDDKISRDHDWGPGFAIWIPEETDAKSEMRCGLPTTPCRRNLWALSAWKAHRERDESGYVLSAASMSGYWVRSTAAI